MHPSTKINTKQTILVGLAFFSICAFWQLYDGVIPLILKNTFHMPDDKAGFIMALDNILALFMLPFFGKLSDRTTTRFGKRTPYIIGGTLCSVALMNVLMHQTNNLTSFIVVLGLLLIAMGTYRSPAVALMPDTTPKLLRSKGNAIINLTGALGGMLTLVAISLFVTTTANGQEDYTLVFFVVSMVMLISVAILFFTVHENKIRVQEDAPIDSTVKATLPKPMKKSLYLILASVFLWFMGYNAVTTAYTKYAAEQWQLSLNSTALCLMVATVGAVISYIPIGILSTRFGRKKMIQIGVLLLCACFAGIGFFSAFSPVLYGIFLLVGFSWAMINVNSYPMVVEISKGSDIGKYTGLYYTFSMAAQISTPILSGLLLQHVGYYTLFPYSAIMVALSFVTICLAKHGDHKPLKKQSVLETFDAGDD